MREDGEAEAGGVVEEADVDVEGGMIASVFVDAVLAVPLLLGFTSLTSRGLLSGFTSRGDVDMATRVQQLLHDCK